MNFLFGEVFALNAVAVGNAVKEFERAIDKCINVCFCFEDTDIVKVVRNVHECIITALNAWNVLVASEYLCVGGSITADIFALDLYFCWLFGVSGNESRAFENCSCESRCDFGVLFGKLGRNEAYAAVFARIRFGRSCVEENFQTIFIFCVRCNRVRC